MTLLESGTSGAKYFSDGGYNGGYSTGKSHATPEQLINGILGESFVSNQFDNDEQSHILIIFVRCTTFCPRNCLTLDQKIGPASFEADIQD